MKVRLTRDQWFQCIVALSRADVLHKVADDIRDKLAESNAPMGAAMPMVLSKASVEAIGRCVEGRIEESLNRQGAWT